MGGKRERGGKKGEKKGRDESPIIFFLGKSRLHFSGAASCFPPYRFGFFFKIDNFKQFFSVCHFAREFMLRVLVRVKFLWSGKTSTSPRIRDTATVGKRGREGRKVNHLLLLVFGQGRKEGGGGGGGGGGVLCNLSPSFPISPTEEEEEERSCITRGETSDFPTNQQSKKTVLTGRKRKPGKNAYQSMLAKTVITPPRIYIDAKKGNC